MLFVCNLNQGRSVAVNCVSRLYVSNNSCELLRKQALFHSWFAKWGNGPGSHSLMFSMSIPPKSKWKNHYEILSQCQHIFHIRKLQFYCFLKWLRMKKVQCYSHFYLLKLYLHYQLRIFGKAEQLRYCFPLVFFYILEGKFTFLCLTEIRERNSSSNRRTFCRLVPHNSRHSRNTYLQTTAIH